MRRLYFLCLAFAMSYSLQSNAQIGYQVSLLNSATGEPRANETVSCEIKLTDSEDNEIFSETKNAVSNDFGVISLSVGDSDTFENVNWNKLPFYISVYIDDKLIAKSQVLTVPVAEHAKHYGSLTNELFLKAAPKLSSTWDDGYKWYSFKPDGEYGGSFTYEAADKGSVFETISGRYKIVGDFIYFQKSNQKLHMLLLYLDGHLAEILTFDIEA